MAEGEGGGAKSHNDYRYSPYHDSTFLLNFSNYSTIYFDVSVEYFAGGKTPDPNKRMYADVLAETRLRNEEVGIYCCDDHYPSNLVLMVSLSV